MCYIFKGGSCPTPQTCIVWAVLCLDTLSGSSLCAFANAGYHKEPIQLNNQIMASHSGEKAENDGART